MEVHPLTLCQPQAHPQHGQHQLLQGKNLTRTGDGPWIGGLEAETVLSLCVAEANCLTTTHHVGGLTDRGLCQPF